MSPLRALPREVVPVVVVLAGGVALVTLLAAQRTGPVGLLLPVLALAAVYLLSHPGQTVALLVGVLILCERSEGLLTVLEWPYVGLPGGFVAVDALLVLAVASVGLDRVTRRADVALPLGLLAALALLVLAAMAGILVGTGNGASPTEATTNARALAYLVLVPVMVAAVVHTRRDLVVALTGAAALTIWKAGLGVVSVLASRGITVEGATITYYEPTANALALFFLLAVLAAVLLRARMPTWALLGTPVVFVSLLLSFRRSFWIGVVLGLGLVLILGVSALGRRMLLPVGVLLALGIFSLASSGYRAQGAVVERAQSLEPSKVQVNAQDRYRLDERANVVGEIRRSPVTGRGLGVDWRATERPLPVTHENGRRYTHMVFLWFWLKLGILGVIAYVALMGAGLRIGWRVWRRHTDPLLRVIGLTAVCGLAALAVIETSGSLTGVDERYSAVIGALFGLLAVAVRLPARPR